MTVVVPRDAGASYVDGYVNCDTVNCSSGTTHFHAIDVGRHNIYCSAGPGDNLQLLSNWALGNGSDHALGWYLDDSETPYCQQVDIDSLCSLNPPADGLRIIIASYYGNNAPKSSMCDGGNIEVIRASEWYPLSGSSLVCSTDVNGALTVEPCPSSWADTMHPAWRYNGANGATWGISNSRVAPWGWISQWSFALNGGSPPSNPGALKSAMDSWDHVLRYRANFPDGTWTSGAEMTY